MKQALTSLMRTEDSLAFTLLRVPLAVVMFTHGAQKLFGWFGGFGLEGTLEFFAGLGIPYFLGAFIVATEIAVSIALLLGVWSRLASFAVVAIMASAVALVHFRHGFFMNWGGNQNGEGFEFHLLAAAMAVAIVIGGSGRFSIDRLFARDLAR